MNQTLIDIEVYTNYFLLGCKNYKTKELLTFEISEKKDQRKELFDFLKSYSGFWISFNGIHYDNMVLAFGQSNKWFLNESTLDTCKKLKDFSDFVIFQKDDDRQALSKYTYFKWRFTNIDLYLYWAKLLRLSKKISLKALGIQMGYPVVQELPYAPETILSESQIEDVKEYNTKHDLGILELLTLQFEGKGHVSLGALGTIQLRGQVVKDYKIDAWSMDGPKIASEVLLKEYCSITNQSINTVRDWRFPRESFKFEELFKDLNLRFELPEFQKVYHNWYFSENTFDEIFLTGTAEHPIRISVGVGGIHAVNNNEIYESIPNERIIVTDDIAAMYPTNIENFNAFRFPEVLNVYKSFKTKRITETKPGMKAHPKGSAEWTDFFQKDLFYKLILNGVSGLLDMEHSWLFNNKGIMKVRCVGQLILMKLIEQCIINNIHVISANTDGLEVMMHPNQFSKYLEIVASVEKQFNVSFEREFYKKIIYSSVNEYIAQTESGQLKKKGSFFITNPELGNSSDFLIIPKLLEQYYIYGVKPEDEIRNPKYTIFDFCASQKVDKSYTVEWMGQKQQRINRYYASKKGGYLYKCRWVTKKATKKAPQHDIYTQTHMLGDTGVMIYNNHIEQPLHKYNIDYTFYLKKVNDIISTIAQNNQINAFDNKAREKISPVL